MALPAIADVRRAAPDASIDDRGAAGGRAAVPAGAGGRRHVVVLDREPTIRAGVRWRRARGRGFDTALLLPNSFHAALTAARAGIPERWGYRDRRGAARC